MKVPMHLTVFLACVLASVAHAQVLSVLKEAPLDAGVQGSVPGPRPSRGAFVGVDVPALKAQLLAAPVQRLDVALAGYGLKFTLPDPEGNLVPCTLAQAPVMEPALAALHPDIRSFIVEAADGSAEGRMELSPRGLTGMLRSNRGIWMIDPWRSADAAHAVVYWLVDLPGGDDWACHTTNGVHGLGAHEMAGYSPRTTQTLRTFRLAMACTGEYGLYQSQIQGHAPNGADPLAAIVTVVGRVNVVYEADLAVHMNLVANEDQVIFFNPDTDPYGPACDGSGGADCSGDYLNLNPGVLSSRIGNANFDIGHVVTRIAGGVAYLSSVCTSSKAGGVSGIPRGGDVDPFSALVVIHEMGHQYGANHTFSGTRGRCAGNVNLSTAWEAGSGSSPMAYAGGCPVGDAPPSDNIQLFADPFFHHGSYLEMTNFLSGASCAVQTATTNNIPVFTFTTPSTAIPPGTPFTLTAAATDADNEALTYSWEQFDSGVARPLSGAGAVDNGAGALFRVFPPVASGARTFPKMADVLSGVTTPGERLPTVTGVTRHFRAIVRDNHPGAGGAAVTPMVNVQIPAGTTPFTVVSPSQYTIVRGATTVTWTTGGTAGPPISLDTVTIRLSTDDGATFPTVIGTTANTGSAHVTLPTINAHARLRIDADNHIFFAVSRPFFLGLPCSADFNRDGDVGTDADIEAVFACLAGNCCATCDSVDFDGNGDVGTDADIEAFFRVLAGGAC